MQNKVNLSSMRVLLITDNHSPTGGAENYFFDLKERLKKNSEMNVFSLGFGTQTEAGDDFYILKSPRSKISKLLGQIIFNPLVFLKLRRQLKKINPDVIHIHNIKQYSTTLLHAIKPYPVVQTMHDYSYICPESQNIHQDLMPCPTGLRLKCFAKHQNKFNPLIYLMMTLSFLLVRKQIQKTVKRLIAPSPLLVDYLEKNRFQNVTYIPPFTIKQPLLNDKDMKPGHFLFVGQLGRHKGVHLLLDEFAIACKKNNQLRLKIAGLGPEEKSLRQKIKKWGLDDNVQFLGWQDNLDNLYRECVAVIFPSIGLESFGLVITESMAYKRPVIGTNRGTASWLIEDNQSGLLFNPIKKGDLADKIMTLANLTFAQQLGEKAFEKLSQFNNEDSINQIINIYRSLKNKQI